MIMTPRPAGISLFGIALLPVLSLLGGPVLAQTAAPEAAWVGTWKLDPARSHMTGDTITYSKKSNGLFHVDAGGTARYDFGIDGKEYPAAYGSTTTWTAVGDHAWDAVTRTKGVTTFKVHRELSGDDKTLTVTATGANADGSPMNETTVYTRIDGTTGLVGTWRDVQTNAGSPPVFAITSPSPGVLRWEIPTWKQYVQGKPDGTDIAVQGDGKVPAGMTFSAKWQGPGKLAYTLKFNGKPDQYGVQTLAADGRSYTDVSYAPGHEHEKTTCLYVKE